MRRSPRSQDGFTLIEMLAATTLLAVIFGIVMNSMGQAMQAYARDEVKTRMGLMARSLLVDVSSTSLVPGFTSGQESGIDWRLECIAMSEQSGIQLLHLKLTLRHASVVQNFSTLRVQQLKSGRRS
ncbi:type II secretion system protein [Pseudomonas brenneri]|uniref:Prepilin-type N-terminal cleavage/methylation domain-containing protein n=1 Tax=Pseudomonas brenneri TaxID=129817 RepID=A0A5B2UI49_9PSED|nr:prepilin-type N-terminal cleavage/methylation domain-containing protein [Pseudomonas brenneri]KAA2226162.1 prepilin-type N-terminal cleavage/methylation domain-containing protein [Pseudomonas brenneri]TWR71614.1 prepilin-type N-terminal cleavage/methylation domain-containing protein [Pseudomonas brenneri]